jgi:hypothetical protein
MKGLKEDDDLRGTQVKYDEYEMIKGSKILATKLSK